MQPRLQADQGPFTAGVVAVTCVAAAGVGALSGVSPLAGALPVGAAGVVALLALGRQLPALFLATLVVLLAAYAFLGRGGAYLGVEPLFISEAGLVLALLTVLTTVGHARLGALHWLLVAFAAWGLLRTLPYLGRDGLAALRDAVVWGYAAFALAISFSVGAAQFPRVVALYRRGLPFFLLWVPVAAILTLVAPGSVPTIPGSNVGLVEFKGGDAAVHLSGAAAFLLLGLYASRSRSGAFGESLLWPVWFAGVAIAVALSRAGLAAVALAVGVTFLLRPSRRWVPFVVVAAILLALAQLTNVSVDLGREREVSLEQVTGNILSVVSESESSELQGTKDWRMEWWGEIYDYTVRGPYFWTGKGFGINLADDDGFQVADGSLRSPHNGHMTILARMGVPGLALWILVQSVFGLSLLRAFFRAGLNGDAFWMQVDGWLFVYWLAMMTNMFFDVYLEGPQGGIWFWSIFGLGLAALTAQATTAAPATERSDADPGRP